MVADGKTIREGRRTASQGYLGLQSQRKARVWQMNLEIVEIFSKFAVLLFQQRGALLVSSLSGLEQWKPRPSCAGCQTSRHRTSKRVLYVYYLLTGLIFGAKQMPKNVKNVVMEDMFCL